MQQAERVLIVGCGAMGGLFAAALAPHVEVAAYDTNSAHVDAIRERGLRVTGASERLARFEISDHAEDFRGASFSVVFFFTKSQGTGTALTALASLFTREALVVTLQNGIGHCDLLLAGCGGPVARGVTLEAGRYVEPGCIEHLISGKKTWLGPARGRVDDLRRVGELLTAAGLPTELVADPMGAVWAKFVFNCVMNPIGALLLGVNAARYESAEVRALIDDMAAECIAVARALGAEFAFDPMGYVNDVRAGKLPVSGHAGSMALDIARGAPTEIDELTGFMVEQAERLGIPAPSCKAVYRLVKGLELAASRTRGR